MANDENTAVNELIARMHGGSPRADLGPSTASLREPVPDPGVTTMQTTSMTGTAPTMRPPRCPVSRQQRPPLRGRACLTSSVREGRQPCPSSLPLSPVASSTTG